MISNSAPGFVFWVVSRDKSTRKIISTKQFSTHEEAVRYHVAPDGDDSALENQEVAIEILASGKTPK